MFSKKILILAANQMLAPRVQIEQRALEECGYITDVIYRGRVRFNLNVFLDIIPYYVKCIYSLRNEKYFAVHLSHIIHLPLSIFIKMTGKKVVYDAFERHSVDIAERHAPAILKKRVKKTIELFENWIVKHFVDAVLVVSTPNEYLYKRYHKLCSIVDVIYNVPMVEYCFKGNVQRKISRNPFIIAYAGGLSPEKGLDRFIPLFQALHNRSLDVIFYLIGSFANKYIENQFKDHIDSLCLSDRIIVTGHIEYFNLFKTLSNCHVGLLLHTINDRYTHVGRGTIRKKFEYMASATVVLASNIGELGSVILEENCGYILYNPDDIEGIACLIEKLYYDRNLCSNLANNGLSAVQKKYNWSHEKNKLIKIYNTLLTRAS